MLKTVMAFRCGSQSFNARLFIGEDSIDCSFDWAEERRKTVRLRADRSAYRSSFVENLCSSVMDVFPDRCSHRFSRRIFSTREFHCVSRSMIWRCLVLILGCPSSVLSVRVLVWRAVDWPDCRWVCNPKEQVCRSSFRWSHVSDEGGTPIGSDSRVSRVTC